MGNSLPRRQRRTARAASGDGADQPSDLRQALADLGRVIGEPFPPDAARAGAAGPHPDTDY